jgi:minichromosome maintenance protein 10
VKKAQLATATSPQRVILGIDKGLKAADVSLKRASSVRNTQDTGNKGGYLRTSRRPDTNSSHTGTDALPISFNDRLASARQEELSRQERQERIQKMRSTNFSVGRQEMEQYKTEAIDVPEIPLGPPKFSRDEIVSGPNQQRVPLQRINPTSAIRSGGGTTSITPLVETRSPTSTANTAADIKDSETAIDPFSGYHLSKRILPHNVLARAVTGMRPYSIQDLLRLVKAPDWSLPDIEQDIVVFAILARKSDPRSHKNGTGDSVKAPQDRGKYMVLTLVDLKFEIELFLFNSGFERFWKLSPKTVVAILNPMIMPPPKGREATGRFSLVIKNDADTVLEIGTARDLGYCRSIKKDGQLCDGWINAKRTEYCEFHTNAAVAKSRANRIELNGMSFGSGGARKSKSLEATYRNLHRMKEDRPAPPGPTHDRDRGTYDRETQTKWYVSNASHNAGLMDEERENGMADRAERGEALKRRLMNMERERDIAKRLGKVGGGAGREYMARAATVGAELGSSLSSSSSTAVAGSLSSDGTIKSILTGDMTTRVDARALGLVAPRGEQPKIDLAPVKRKRPDGSQVKSSTGSTGAKPALGWGTSLKDKLARMKEGEALDGRKPSLTTTGSISSSLGSSLAARSDRSPVRKKTRFITEKGIREAGRESLGEPLSASRKTRHVVLDDDDDDDLLIVK